MKYRIKIAGELDAGEGNEVGGLRFKEGIVNALDAEGIDLDVDDIEFEDISEES